MTGVTSWSFHPYKPLLFDTGDIYICRVYPGEGRVSFDWLPLDGVSDYTVNIRRRGDGEYSQYKVSGTSFTLGGLEDETDYEFYVCAKEGTAVRKSRVRLARTGKVPGESVVNYLHPEDGAYSFSGQYLCSPSLVRHPDGFLLASMDVFKGGEAQDLTLIFRSDDDGKTWKYISELFPCFWGKMFIHRGELYMLGCSTEYGDMLIGKSSDGGVTFGMPTVLLRGTYRSGGKGVHRNPENIVRYNGRLWNTLEWGSWASGSHATMVASIDENEDLLDASKWHFSPPVPYDPSWEGCAKGKSAGNIEGTLVVSPNGELLNVLRYQIGRCVPSYGLALIMKPNTTDPDAPEEFYKVIEFPGNHAKFEIYRDEVSGKYVSIVCYLCEEHQSGRNWLALIYSDDLEHWKKALDIFDCRDSDENKIGFQYVDFFIEGEDILMLSRTAFNGAANYHDANYSVFHRIAGFRRYLN